MTHIVREVVRPGQYIFKVFDLRGALMYHGASESVATATVEKLKKQEKKRESLSSNS